MESSTVENPNGVFHGAYHYSPDRLCHVHVEPRSWQLHWNLQKLEPEYMVDPGKLMLASLGILDRIPLG